MKKHVLWFALVSAVLSFGLIACPNGVDDNGGTSYTAIESKTVEKKGSYNEDISLDLSSTPLAANAFSVGDDITEYFEQSTISVARAATTSEDGLSDMKVTVKSFTTVKLEVTITASTADTDCTVVITAVIPAEKTENKQAVVQAVKKVIVGEGGATSNTGTISIASSSVPSASDMADKILKVLDDSNERIKYYKFDSTGKNVSKSYYSPSGNLSTSSTTYTYDPKTGRLTENGEDEVDAFIDEADYLIKIGDTYYFYEKGMKLERTSGSGLDSTFTYSLSLDEKLKHDEEIVGTGKASMTTNLTTHSDSTFTGGVVWNTSVTYTDAAKEKYPEEAKDSSESENRTLSGIYVNKDGVITFAGKQISTYNDEDGKVKTETEDFENEIALYDGTNLYLGEKLEMVSAMDGK